MNMKQTVWNNRLFFKIKAKITTIILSPPAEISSHWKSLNPSNHTAESNSALKTSNQPKLCQSEQQTYLHFHLLAQESCSCHWDWAGTAAKILGELEETNTRVDVGRSDIPHSNSSCCWMSPQGAGVLQHLVDLRSGLWSSFSAACDSIGFEYF